MQLQGLFRYNRREILLVDFFINDSYIYSR